jgi:superfamily II DNA or RNA helicase
MSLNLQEFFISYPDYYNDIYKILNPFDTPMYETINSLKEFTQLEQIELKPNKSGIPLTHQRNISHFMSPLTEFDRLLLFHGLGSGKSCTAVNICELAMKLRPDIGKSLIISGNESLLEDFREQLVKTCTSGQYLPENYQFLTDNKYKRRRNKLLDSKYEFHTRETFAKNYLSRIKAEEIIRLYSNRIIIIDEAHHLTIQPIKTKKKKLIEPDLDVYKEFHRLLHFVKNCKVILLTGTPMRDDPREIASLMNLILPIDKQLPYKAFHETFYDENKRLKNKNILYEAFHGRISYLRKMEDTTNVKIILEPSDKTIQEYKDNNIVLDPYPNTPNGKMEKIKVMALPMNKFQKKIYIQAYKRDISKEKGKKSAFYENSQQAGMFVYPDDINYLEDPDNATGSYGKEGFSKYFTENKKTNISTMKKTLQKLLLHNTQNVENKEEKDKIILYNIKQCGIKIGETIEMLLNRREQLSFVFAELVRGSGTILFASLLQLFNYSQYKPSERKSLPVKTENPKFRYALIDGKTPSNEIRSIISVFNTLDNLENKYISVIIGSSVISEGYSFYNINNCFILNPHWNNATIEQAIGRTNRAFSHFDELKLKELHIYRLAVQSPKNSKSIDLIMYKLSVDKEFLIMPIMRMMKETSVDCSLNRNRNIKDNDVKGSRECEYQNCNYECKECTWYSPNQTELKDLDDKINKQTWSCKTVVVPEEKNSINYNLYFAENEIERIKIEIKNLYKINFVYELQQILNYFRDRGNYMIILRSLKELIDDSIPIYNKYGFQCYLRENNNLYFLVDNITYTNDYNILYYVEHPATKEQYSFNILLDQVKIKYLTSTIKYISSLPYPDDQKEQEKYYEEIGKELKILPRDIQEIFLEKSILARSKLSDKKVKKKEEFVSAITNFFLPFVSKKDNYYISTLYMPNHLRCFDMKNSSWDDCDQFLPFIKQIQEQKQVEVKEKRKSLAEQVLNDTKYYGVMLNGKFHIRRVALKEHIYGTPSKGDPTKLVKKGVTKPTGKSCDPSFKMWELAYISVMIRVKLPDDYKYEIFDRKEVIDNIERYKIKISGEIKDFTTKQLNDIYHRYETIKKIKSIKDYDKLNQYIKDNKLIPISELTDEQLNILDYHLSITKKPLLCGIVREQFEQLDLLDVINTK